MTDKKIFDRSVQTIWLQLVPSNHGKYLKQWELYTYIWLEVLCVCLLLGEHHFVQYRDMLPYHPCLLILGL